VTRVCELTPFLLHLIANCFCYCLMQTRNPNSIASYPTLSASVIPDVKLKYRTACRSWTQVFSLLAYVETITNYRRTDQPCRLCRIEIAAPICTLPDDVLLEIFSIYVDCVAWPDEDAWHTLVHVCQRWRSIVFASPHHLNVQLRCTNKRSALMMLDVWPALPIAVEFRRLPMSRLQVSSNIITALNQRDRIRKIDLSPIPVSLLRKIRAIEEPLPMLTDLKFASQDDTVSLLDSLLGGSAPRLRSLHLIGIPFPALPKLLLSTAELVTLYASSIPHSLHTSPETIVYILSTLTKLQNLSLGFQSPQPLADNASRLLLPLTRVVLPALTSLHFLDYDEYLEDIVSRIDTPLLDNMTIGTFKRQVFDTRQLRCFISHTEAFKSPHRADIDITGSESSVSLIVFSRGATSDHKLLKFTTQRLRSSFSQFCISALPPLSTLKRLDIRKSRRRWQGPISNRLWVDLLRLFTSVTDLVVSGATGHVATALQGITVEGVTDVLPALQNLFLEISARSGPNQETIAQFVATRWLSDRPVTVLYED